MPFTVGIAGITGKFARCIVHNLLESPGVSIRGYCRDPSKLSPAIASKAQVIKGDAYDHQALQSFAKGCDVVINCYLGDNKLMSDGQKAVIDACEAENVPRYVASDYTLNYRNLEYGSLPSKDPMKEIEEYLRGKKVKGVHVLIGAFMDTFWSPFFGMWNEKETTLAYWGIGNETWESTSYGNASEYVAAVALDPNATGFLEFLGDRKNVFEIAEVFESVHGKKLNLVNKGSLDDLYAYIRKIQEQEPSNYFKWLPLTYQYYCTNGSTYLRQDLDNKKYPQIKPITFKDFLQSHSIGELSGANQAVGSDV